MGNIIAYYKVASIIIGLLALICVPYCIIFHIDKRRYLKKKKREYPHKTETSLMIGYFCSFYAWVAFFLAFIFTTIPLFMLLKSYVDSIMLQ